MRSLARWGTLPLAAWPLGSWALGLGDIETNSYLNQPLNAEIELSATPEELRGLSVSLAPVSAFTARGLDYPALLNSLRFEVGRNDEGQNVVFVRSREAIAEPFVTLVVQVAYGQGAFQREYSVLLDPPLFLPAGQAPEPIAAPVTREPTAPAAGGQIERPAQPVQPAQRAAEPAAPAPQPARTPVVATDGSYSVQSGDTLWRIAETSRPAGVTTNQAMLAIFEANPQAFDGNINRLRRGAILRIPPASGMGTVAASAATAEVQRQMQAWQSGAAPAPRVVLLPPSEDGAAAGAALGGADSGAVTALENEVTSLQSELAATRAELEEAERLLELRSSELADLQSTVGTAAEAAAADVAEPPAAEAEQLFVDEQPEPVAAEPEVAEAEAEAPAPVPSAVPGVTTTDSGPSLVETILATVLQPIVLGGAGVLVVLLGALAFLRRRRSDEEDVTGQWEALEADLEDDIDHAATARLRARVEPDMVVIEGHDGDATAEEPRLGSTAEFEALGAENFGRLDGGTTEIEALTAPDEFESSWARKAKPAKGAAKRREPEPEPSKTDQTLSSQTVINLDQADPIAEADFHMAYGLYDQAADLISKALEADPDDRALKLKLLEVYFVWGNKEQFLESAKAIRSELGASGRGDWDKVVIMGKQICPDEPLFAGATTSAGKIDLDLESSGEAAGLDFAFGDESDDDVDLDFGPVDDGGLSLAQSGAHAVADADDDLLDIGEKTQAGLEAALFESVDDSGARTTLGDDLRDADATMESPTVESRGGAFDDDFASLMFENPTVEAEVQDEPTVETPTIESPAARDVGDTIEQQRPTAATTELTAEIELDDLGLDLAGLEELPDEIELSSDDDDDSLSISLASADMDDDELLSATGVTQVLHQDDDVGHTGTAVLGDNEATMMAPGFDAESPAIRTAVLEQPIAGFDHDGPETEDDLDLNLDDFSSALEGGADTVEQPVASRFGDIEFDVGIEIPADDEPTGTEDMGSLDPQTMTEVGTKLDLARAYIDMGDPEGAKSILEEVLSEGDSGQRSEAQALIAALPA